MQLPESPKELDLLLKKRVNGQLKVSIVLLCMYLCNIVFFCRARHCSLHAQHVCTAISVNELMYAQTQMVLGNISVMCAIRVEPICSF